MIFQAALFSALASVAFSGYTFPDDFKSCSAYSGSDCLVHLIQDALYKLGTKGISSPIKYNINPMILPSWTLRADTDFLKAHEYFWDLRHPTLWNSTVLAASFDKHKNVLKFTTYTNHLLQQNSRYYLWAEFYDGKSCDPDVLYGNGTVNKNIYDLTMEHTISVFPTEIDGAEHFFLRSYHVAIKDYSDVDYDYKNFYNGDEERGSMAKRTINAYVKENIRDQPEVFINLLVTMFEYYAQLLLTSVPASKMRAHFAG